MFDDLTDIFTLRDLFAPLTAVFGDITNGPSCFFGVPILAGWSKRKIRNILAQHGVKVWGVIYGDEEVIFSVREDQAQLAHKVLTSAGVPITYPTEEALKGLGNGR